MTESHKPNAGQAAALESLTNWVKDPAGPSFAVLRGPAGTGKTWLQKELVKAIGRSFLFAAPTNKATRVLRRSFSDLPSKPICRTIYSLLGLRMEPNGEIRELTAAKRAEEEQVNFADYAALNLDEASMASYMLMLDHIVPMVQTTGSKVLLIGDQYQLPPVGEAASPAWMMGKEVLYKSQKVWLPEALEVSLTEPVRFGGDLQKLALYLRDQLDRPTQQFQPQVTNDGETGVWWQSPEQFKRTLLEHAEAGHFHKPDASKAIAWRNVRVDELNRIIRNQYFPGVDMPWVEDDRLVFTAPAVNLEGDIEATTDDEGRVTKVSQHAHPIYGEIEIYSINVELDDGKFATARVPTASGKRLLDARLQDLAHSARMNSRFWKDFWSLKEAFHEVRHAYAVTAHRSQGSTYQEAFVDYRDMLANRNRREAFQCLYVGCTRPQKRLFLS